MHSCIYEGAVKHQRRQPVVHQFQYRLYMVYLDLAELAECGQAASLVSQRRFSPAAFLRRDHLAGRLGPLDAAVRGAVEERTGIAPRGPIRLLTQLRYFGCYFSPLNLYYCFRPDESGLEAILAEVNNTPWAEQHCYVLWDGNRQQHEPELAFTHAKEFHVSPFMDMNLNYDWRLSVPGQDLHVRLHNRDRQGELFQAELSLRRKPLTRWNLTRMQIRYPLITARIISAIYFQALRLWWKQCPFFPHPTEDEPLQTTPRTIR